MHIYHDGGTSYDTRPFSLELAEETADKVLSSQLHDRGNLFLPDSSFFKLNTAKDLERSGKELFRWLGIKPRHITYKFATIATPAEYRQHKDHTEFIINAYFQDHSIITAGILAHLTIHHLLDLKRFPITVDESSNESLTNYLLVEAGFGLLALNAVGQSSSVAHKYRKLFKPERNANELFPDVFELSQFFEDFLTKYRIHLETYASHLLPSAKQLLPEHLQEAAHQHKPVPVYIRTYLSTQRRRILLVSLIVTLFVLLSCGIWIVTRPVKQGLTATQQQMLQSIEDLAAQADACDRSVQAHESNIDRSDIAAQRVIESEKAVCASQRNYYNYRYSQFQDSTKN